jgi:hypothetical protein
MVIFENTVLLPYLEGEYRLFTHRLASRACMKQGCDNHSPASLFWPSGMDTDGYASNKGQRRYQMVLTLYFGILVSLVTMDIFSRTD